MGDAEPPLYPALPKLPSPVEASASTPPNATTTILSPPTISTPLPASTSKEPTPTPLTPLQSSQPLPSASATPTITSVAAAALASLTPTPSNTIPPISTLTTPSLAPTSSSFLSPPSARLSSQLQASPQTTSYTPIPASTLTSLSPQSLRETLLSAQQYITQLQKSLEDSRAQTRHWLLQHQMLSADYSNAQNRYEVELTLSKREVEVLRRPGSANYHHGAHSSIGAAVAAGISNSFGAVAGGVPGEEDVQKLSDRLARAKNLILEERAAKKDLEDTVERLKKRIRENRRHDNMVDRAILHVEATRAGSLKRGESGLSTASMASGEDGLAALGEVATKVLMEGLGGGSTAGVLGTPGRKTAAAATGKKRRRRKSRDSTISASDAEEDVPLIVAATSAAAAAGGAGTTPQKKVPGGRLVTGSPGTPKRARTAGAGGSTPRSVKRKGATSAAAPGREAFGAALSYVEE